MKLPTAGLTPPQIALVAGVFVFTLLGAIALALALRWWNGRSDPIIPTTQEYRSDQKQR